VPKASDPIASTYVSMMLKGPFGHGKTLAASSFCIDGPVYIAYWDKKGPIELENFYCKIVKRPDLLDNITYDIYGSSNAGEYLEKLLTWKKTGDCRYFAIITDSVTNMTRSSVNWSLNYYDSKKSKTANIVPDFKEYKVETSLITQCLDICKELPAHSIWIAHPVPSIKVEGSGASMKVSKTNPIVTYGSKVAGIIPGEFSEIYHFSKVSGWDQQTGVSSTKYIVDMDAVGDDFAKSNIGLTGQIDITDRMFYELWKERVSKHKQEVRNAIAKPASSINPFNKPAEADNPTNSNTPKWRV
jgi:hypothetical protein